MRGLRVPVRSHLSIFALVTVTVACVLTLAHGAFGATTTPATAATTRSVTADDAKLVAYLLEQNAKTMSRIRSARYHMEQTLPPRTGSPEARVIAADVERSGSDMWWRMRLPLNVLKTGMVENFQIVGVRDKTAAAVWYVNSAQCERYLAKDDGTLPELSARHLRIDQPFDVLSPVAAADFQMVIDLFSKPPQWMTAQRDPNDPRCRCRTSC